MVNINNFKCVVCSNKALYNYLNKDFPEYCKLCKLANMYLLSKYKNYYKCYECNELLAEFNYTTKTKVKYCINCKTDDMIQIVNIKHDQIKYCIKCNKNEATHNYYDINKAEFCKICKTKDMVRQYICLCKQNVAQYNYMNEKIPICCKSCKDLSMVNVKEHKCELCNLFNTYKVYCTICDSTSNTSKRKKTKEYDVLLYLQSNLKEYDIIYNETIGTECTDKNIYPDIRIDLNWYQLILEVDEFQHRGANYKCDMQRMYDAVAKLGMPCVFIRYNPDSTKSSKDVLLQTIRNTVNELVNNGLTAFNDYGLKVLYLFYS